MSAAGRPEHGDGPSATRDGHEGDTEVDLPQAEAGASASRATSGSPSGGRAQKRASAPPGKDAPTLIPPSIQSWTRYENVEFLGAGGMGKVYKATDPKLHRVVALKFLRENEPDHVRRLLREAQAQASIDHPNICKV